LNYWDFGGLVSVSVQAPGGQKPRLDWTFKHYVSKPYIEALQKVRKMGIPSLPKSQNFGLPVGTKPDVLLLKFIRGVQKDFHTKTPKLLTLITDISLVSFPIYNNTIYAEIHRLLLELLSHYEQAVVDLYALSW